MNDDIVEGRQPPASMIELGPTDPQQVGPYELIGRLGSGGMGIAYLGQRDGKWAVLKVLGQGAPLTDADITRWERELDAMKAAESARTVHLLDHDFTGRPPWFAMEFVPGHTLQYTIDNDGPIPSVDLKPFALGLALALSDIHAAGVVHRDLKPSNIMLTPAGPRIIDFGVAALEDATMLTKTGHIVGTVGWLAPEQITKDDYSNATDVHAWGLCVLFAATGGNPYSSMTSGAALYKILHERPEVSAEVPPELAELVVRSLAKEPGQRPELAQVIQRLEGDAPTAGSLVVSNGFWVEPTLAPAPKRRGLVVASLIAIVVGVAAGIALGLSLVGG